MKNKTNKKNFETNQLELFLYSNINQIVRKAIDENWKTEKLKLWISIKQVQLLERMAK
jgi:hypothetical protein